VFSKLLIISGIFPPDPGGPAKFASEFSEWSYRNGADVKVISYVDEIRTNSPTLTRKFLGVSRKSSLLIRYLKMIITVSKSVQKEDRVIAVGAFLEIYIASIVKKIKYVAKVPGDIVWERARNNQVTELDINDYQESKLPLRYRLFRFLFTMSLKRASLVIVPSNGLFQLCIQWGIPESRLRLIQNSVDLSKFSTLKRNSFKFDVLTVCRLAPWKGVDELIEVCARHDLTLAVAGDGPERAKLEKLGAQLGLDVNFFGDVSEDKILELLSSSKIFVLNSHYEGLPHALVEARAAGMISVARDGTGSAEVVRDREDGFLVGEKLTLSEAVAMAIREFNSSSYMGEIAAIDTRERFDRKRSFEKISHVLQEYNS
jgi:glycosyltransferase involved in cell wall biosynthesis